MKKFMRHICAAALVLVCCTSFLASASALERASSYIAKYTANVTAAGGGKGSDLFGDHVPVAGPGGCGGAAPLPGQRHRDGD